MRHLLETSWFGVPDSVLATASWFNMGHLQSVVFGNEAVMPNV